MQARRSIRGFSKRTKPLLATAAFLLAIAVLATTIADVRATRRELHAVALNSSVEVGQLREEVDALKASAAANGSETADLRARVDDAPDPSAVARSAQGSVMTIETEGGTGSAWVVSSTETSSLLVTNFHVVSGVWSSGGGVTIRHGQSKMAAVVSSVSQHNDLALISLPQSFPALKRATVRPTVGDPVVVVGSPLGLDGSVASGLVSAFREEDGTELLQFSAPISPGSSGGPVLHAGTGEVVGVSVGKWVGRGIEGVSFAVPIGRLCPALKIC